MKAMQKLLYLCLMAVALAVASGCVIDRAHRGGGRDDRGVQGPNHGGNDRGPHGQDRGRGDDRPSPDRDRM